MDYSKCMYTAGGTLSCAAPRTTAGIEHFVIDEKLKQYDISFKVTKARDIGDESAMIVGPNAAKQLEQGARYKLTIRMDKQVVPLDCPTLLIVRIDRNQNETLIFYEDCNIPYEISDFNVFMKRV